jgi:hypothetical protein
MASDDSDFESKAADIKKRQFVGVADCDIVRKVISG